MLLLQRRGRFWERFSVGIFVVDPTAVTSIYPCIICITITIVIAVAIIIITIVGFTLSGICVG